MSPLVGRPSPETLEPEPRRSRCKRSCCWSPFGHSSAAERCTCHREDWS